MKLFSIPGYVHLHRSLLRFCKLDMEEAQELVYNLNTANLDSYRWESPQLHFYESSPFSFCKQLKRNERPYRTEVQLYKAWEALSRNIRYEALISDQREAMQKMNCLMRNLEFNFYKVFGLEINSPITVYRQCRNHLIPYDDEPSVCLFHDWVHLPTA